MIVINAVINNSHELGFEQSRLLDESMAQMGVEKYSIVSLLPRLLDELEANRHKEVLLFSNFPPLNSYLINSYLEASRNQYAQAAPNWEIPQYAISAGFFYQICRQYRLKAIHFITGARTAVVKDSQILSLTGDIPATVKRKHDWTGPEKDYEVLLRLYLMTRIKEALEIK